MRGYEPHNHPGELYNLNDDLPERRNRYAERPDLVRDLTALLRRIQGPEAPTDSNTDAHGPGTE